VKLWSQPLDESRQRTEDYNLPVLALGEGWRIYSIAHGVRGFALLKIFRRDPKLGNHAGRILLE